MKFAQIVAYIATHHDSHYLVPLSQRYAAYVWNRLMRQAWQLMGIQ